MDDVEKWLALDDEVNRDCYFDSKMLGLLLYGDTVAVEFLAQQWKIALSSIHVYCVSLCFCVCVTTSCTANCSEVSF